MFMVLAFDTLIKQILNFSWPSLAKNMDTVKEKQALGWLSALLTLGKHFWALSTL